MEKEGLCRAMKFLCEQNIPIEAIVTGKSISGFERRILE
jgi:hypothetical protein